MNGTVREICENLISDRVLKDYSYLGRRTKCCFKDYDNIKDLIVKAATDSFIKEKKNLSQEEVDVEEIENSAELYFTTEYIKHATKRYESAIKKLAKKNN